MHPGAPEYQQVRLLRQTDAPGCIPTSYCHDIQAICVANMYLTKIQASPKTTESTRPSLIKIDGGFQIFSRRGHGGPPGESAQTDFLAGLKLRFGSETIKLAELANSDTIARGYAAERIATAHGVVARTVRHRDAGGVAAGRTAGQILLGVLLVGGGVEITRI